MLQSNQKATIKVSFLFKSSMLKLNLDPQPGLPLEVEIKTVRPYGDALSRGNVNVHVNNVEGGNAPPPPPPPPPAININNHQTQDVSTGRRESWESGGW